MTTAIHIKDIHKGFNIPRGLKQILKSPFSRKRIQVLNGVSLAVPTGMVCGLLGPNGAGKTTLLRILGATVLPDSGSVHILGQDAARHALKVRQRIGYVLADERSFFWRLSARQNLVFFGILCDLTRAHAKIRAVEVADLLRIADELDKPFRDLSTGMRQRLAIARALLHDPEVLLFDEPTRGLDPGAAQRTRKLIRELLADEMKKTILLATHNLEEASQITHRLAFLKDGNILEEGPTAETVHRIPEVFDMEETEKSGSHP